MTLKPPTYSTGRPETTNFFLPRMDPSLFHTPAVKAAVERTLSLSRQRGDVLNWNTLLSDPVIDENYRAQLRKYTYTDPQPDSGTCAAMLDTLHKYRDLRVLHRIEAELNAGLNSPSANVEELKERVGALLAQVNGAVSDEIELWHYGEGNNTASLIEEELTRTKPNLLPTGFKDFDDINGGLPANGLVVMAAFTSSLKSAMANQLCINWYYNLKINVAKVSLEMTARQENNRFLSNISGISLQRITQVKMTEEDKDKYAEAAKSHILHGKDNACRLSLLTPKRSISLTAALTLLKPFGYKVIVIDYITLLEGSSGDQQWKDLSNIAREAKIFGDINGILVILLAQLDDENKIKYSRAIQEHSDGVWKWAVSDADRDAGQFTVKQVKGRDQELISFDLQVDFTTLTITSLNSSRPLPSDDPDVALFSEGTRSSDAELLDGGSGFTDNSLL